MSKVIDNYAVRMDFDNARFERNVQTSLNTIDRLKKSVNFHQETNSLRDFQRTANRFDLSGMERSLSNLERRFSTLGIVGMRVIENLTDSAMRFATRTVSTITDSIVTGGINRAMNVEGAHFMLQGLLHDEEKVQAVMQQAKDSVDGTAYAYDAAAKAASMFTASGMEAGEELDIAMKSLADVTAATNSNYEDMALIFTQISGKGRLMGDELLQLSSRGMNAAAMIAKYYREVRGEVNTTEADIRDLTSKGQIDFKTFAEAMEYSFGGHAKKANETFQGVTSNIRAALAKIGEGFISLQDDADGFNISLIAQNGPLVNMLNAVRERINDIKENIKPLQKEFLSFSKNSIESMTRWIANFDLSDTFEIFTNFAVGLRNFYNGLASFFTPIGEAFGTVFSPNVIKMIVNLSKGFKDLTSGMKVGEGAANKLYYNFINLFLVFQKFGNSIKGIVQAFFPMENVGENLFKIFNRSVSILTNCLEALRRIITPVGEAFQEVFSTNILANIRVITKEIKRFTDGLKLNDKDAQNLKDTFKGLFSILKIVGQAIGGVAKALFPMAEAGGNIVSVLLSITGAMGRFISSLEEGVTKSKTFQKVADIFTKVSKVIKKATNASSNALSTFADYMRDNFKVFDVLGGIIDAFLQDVSTLKKKLEPTFKSISEFVSKAFITGVKALGKVLAYVGKCLGQLFEGFDFNSILDAINAGAFFVFMKTLRKVAKQIGGSILSISVVFKSFFGNLNNTIGAAGNLSKSIQMVLGTVNTSLKKFQKNLDAQTLKTIAISIAILAGALFVLSTINPERVNSSLFAMTVMIIDLAAAMKALDTVTGGKGFIKTIGSTIALSIAIVILAGALKTLASIKPDRLISALMGLWALFAELAIFSYIMEKSSTKLAKGSVGLILLAVALNVMASAIQKLGANDPLTLVKGLTALWAILAEIAIFSRLMKPEGMIATGVAMIAMGAALNIMASAVKKLGETDPESLVAGLVSIGIIFMEIASFSRLMKPEGMITTGVAMIAMGAALNIMASAIEKLGSLDPASIVKGLLSVWAILAEIAIFAYIMKPDGMIATGIAMIAIGAGLNILATAVQKLGENDIETLTKGLLGIGVALMEIAAFTLLVPVPQLLAAGPALIMIGIGLTQMSNAVAILGSLSLPDLIKGVGALVYCLAALAVAAIAMTGALAGAAAMMVMAVAIRVLAPALVLLGSLSIGQVAIALITLAGAFVIIGVAGTALGLVAPFIVLAATAMLLLGAAVLSLGAGINLAAAGLLTLGAAISSLAAKSSSDIELFINNVSKIVITLAKLIPKVAKLVAKGVIQFVEMIGKHAPKLAKAGVRIVKSFLKGVREIVPDIVKTGIDIIVSLLDGIGSRIDDIIDAGVKIITGFLNGLARNADKIVKAGTNLVVALVKAILKQGKRALTAGLKIGKKALEGVKQTIKHWADAGKEAVKGFIGGLTEIPDKLFSAASNLGNKALNATKDALKINSPSKEFMKVGQGAVSGFGLGFTKNTEGLGKNVADSMRGVLNSAASFVGQFANTSVGIVDQSFLLGQSFSKGFSKGIQNDSKNSQKASKKLGEDAINALDKAIDDPVTESGPISKESEELGESFGRGYTKGIKTYGEPAKAAAEFVAALAIKGLDTGNLAKSMGMIAGGDFVGGLQEAIKHVTPENTADVQRFFDTLVPSQVAAAVGAKSATEMVDAFNNALKYKQDKKKSDTKGTKDKKNKNADTEEKDPWGIENLNDVMVSLSKIFQQYEYKFDAFNSKLLKNGKITIAYLASSVKDSLLANAMRTLGSDVYDKLNKKVDKEYEHLLKKHKKLKKKIDDQTKEDLRNKAAKNVAEGAIQKYEDEFKDLKKTLSKMTDEKTFNTIASIPSAVSTYLNKYNKSFKSVKGVMKSFTKKFGNGASSAVKSLGQHLYEQTDDYLNNQKELKRYAKQLKKIQAKAAKLEAIAFDPNQSLKKRQRAQERLRDLAQQEQEIEKSLKKTTKAIAKGPAKAIEEFRDGVKESVKEFISLSNVDFSKVIDGFSKITRSTNLVDEASSSFDIFSVNLATTSEAATEAADAMGLLNVSVDTGINLLERFSKVSSMSVRRLMKNATSQLKAYQEFQNGIAELRKRGLNSEFVDELAKQGPDSLNYVRGFLKMSASEITEYNKLVAQKAKYEVKATEEAIMKQSADYEAWAKNLAKLAGKVPEEMLEQLKQNGVDGADFVSALVQMDSKALAKVSKTYTASASKVVQTTTESAAETGYKSFKEGVKAIAQQYEQWNKDLETLSARGLSDAVVAKLKEMGVDSTKDYIASMLTETKKGLKEINSYFEKSQNQGKTAAEVWIGDLTTSNNTYKQWNKDMKAIARELGKDNILYTALKEMGWESGSEYARAFVEASSGEKEQILAAFDEQQEFNNNAIMTSLNERIKQVQQWNQDLQTIAGRNGVTKEFYEELVKMGPEAAEQVHAITQLSQTDFEKFATSYSQAINSVPETISNDVTATYAKVAADIISSFTQNVESDDNKKKSKKAVKNHQKDVAKDAKDTGKKHSNALAKLIIKTFAQIITKNKGKEISNQIIKGLKNGIDSGKSDVVNSAVEVATAAIKAAKDALGIKSPSRVFAEIGEFTVEGFAIGLEDYSKRVYDSTDAMAETAIDNMSEALLKVDDVMNGNYQPITPTIRPTLDTSGLYNDILALSSMIDAVNEININLDKERNKDVVNAINEMDERVSSNLGELSRVMTNMQVVMDSGTLVGAITPALDKNLYRRTAMQQRGM